ncbi:MAG: polymer-forming cytoskeletal protein [Acidobacteria bacterium]|jgi:cytoskeletal protein CcmA (bactofilin family)|nr:MAG: polymer-forming cytoskeletal protein [Acidobacteriota bacterium]GIU81587.1 MAG: hypothetical protein KatS3mg006_0651 [Pyrinomonadaceae bacterium]
MIRIGRKPEEEPSSAEKQQEAKAVTQTPAAQASTVQTSTAQTSTAQTTTVTSSNEPHTIEIKGERLNGYVGSGATFVGEATFQAMLRVDGTLTGQVKSEEGTLIVGTAGRVDANVRVGVAIINGVVNGDIFASSRVELGKTAQVTGNIETPRLKIEEGAFFEGKCTMPKTHEGSQKKFPEGPARQQESFTRQSSGPTTSPITGRGPESGGVKST